MNAFRYIALIMVFYSQWGFAMDALTQKQQHVTSSQGIEKSLAGISEYKSYQFGNVVITVAKGDITKTRVDAIVNAANPQLEWGGGVCGAIFNVAGKNKLVDAVDQVLKGASSIAVGQARVTPIPDTDDAGEATIKKRLGVKYVVHAVGPDCRISDQNEKRATLLNDAYRNSLLEANRVGVKSIAFPAISTAIYACPIQDATRVAVDAIVQTSKKTGIKHVLCMFLPNDQSGGYDRYVRELDSLSY